MAGGMGAMAGGMGAMAGGVGEWPEHILLTFFLVCAFRRFS